MKKLPFYFSIDFEDFTHDMARQTGNNKPETRENALELSYKRIVDLSNKYFDGKKMTFFVTGVLARKSPEIVKKIHNDGHEIGCHYNFHDKIDESNREDFKYNLDQAIESIEKVIGEKPIGFRAPIFAISEENTWAYEELAKRFVYDSSYKTSLSLEKTKQGREMNFKGNKLKEFYIYEMKLLRKSFKIRTGGTFLRVLPKTFTIKALNQTINNGHIPLIYLHPYELTMNKEFWLSWNDLKHLKFKKRFIVCLRQRQWLSLGHRSVENKLKKICELFEHQGPMRQLIKESKE